jgi:hypothetical protein
LIVKTFNQRLQSFLNSKTAVEGDRTILRELSLRLKALGKTPSTWPVDRFIDFVQDIIYTSGRNRSVPVTRDNRRSSAFLLANSIPAEQLNVPLATRSTIRLLGSSA